MSILRTNRVTFQIEGAPSDLHSPPAWNDDGCGLSPLLPSSSPSLSLASSNSPFLHTTPVELKTSSSSSDLPVTNTSTVSDNKSSQGTELSPLQMKRCSSLPNVDGHFHRGGGGRRKQHASSPHKPGRHVYFSMDFESTSSSYESAIIGEAHGIVSDMLADSGLPTHVVSGLRTISNLLKPPENHVSSHKPKASPLVSLAESSNYGSDSEDLPYTGERPTSLPKRLRRSLPPSLIRRMSTSTWTTTTSATGLPTLETEPCRNRSSSFRHSRDSTPGSSPSGSRSNSPSPSSPTNVVSLTIPKSRSFSLANVPTSSNQKRAMRERRSLQNVSANEASYNSSSLSAKLNTDSNKVVSPSSSINKTEDSSKDGGGVIKGVPQSLSKRLNITSDYESNDSPSSSDHSDHLLSAEERTGLRGHSAVNKDVTARELSVGSGSQSDKTALISSSSSTSHMTSSITTTVTTPSPQQQVLPSPLESTDSSSKTVVSCHTPDTGGGGDGGDEVTGSPHLPYDLEKYRDHKLLQISSLSLWDYPVFDMDDDAHSTILSLVSYRLFLETGLFDTFRIPIPEFLNYFHALELGYREKPYHNRIHATDVVHGVYYLTSQQIPGFTRVSPDGENKGSSSESDSEFCAHGSKMRVDDDDEETYGVMCRNFPPLELMALYTAAAMHDYDHPGRTNAFLVTTNAPVAVLYNDRSVLESHHAASAWRLFLSKPCFNWLRYLDKGEFKRFRFLVIEAILATDLKRHFELLAEFNAKVNDEDAPGIDWTSESDRLMVSNMVIKMADINGPSKRHDLHVRWTDAISEEFYEQGDEEHRLGLTISPYMDRKNPQLAKLQESFINHLVAPLCNALGAAGLLPGTWVESDTDTEGACCADLDTSCQDTDEENEEAEKERPRQIFCWLTRHLQDNHECWVKVLKEEAAQKEKEEKEKKKLDIEEMEPIKEEDTPPDSASSTSKDAPHGSTIPSPQSSPQDLSPGRVHTEAQQGSPHKQQQQQPISADKHQEDTAHLTLPSGSTASTDSQKVTMSGMMAEPKQKSALQPPTAGMTSVTHPTKTDSLPKGEKRVPPPVGPKPSRGVASSAGPTAVHKKRPAAPAPNGGQPSSSTSIQQVPANQNNSSHSNSQSETVFQQNQTDCSSDVDKQSQSVLQTESEKSSSSIDR